MGIIHAGLTQNTPEWHRHRASHYNASEAAAMMGLSKYKTRNDLLKEKATGITPEIDPFTQDLFDRGHAAEHAAMAVLESLLGDDIAPVVYTLQIGRLERHLSASLDGMTLLEGIAVEHKLYNDKLFSSVRHGGLPEEYMPQCQQILLCSEAEKLVFVCSDGTAQNMAMLEVFPDQDWHQALIDGWKRFEADVKAYAPVTIAEPPLPAPTMQLPTLFVTVSGAVEKSNLPAFEKQAGQYLSSINTDLQTDQDFADAKAQAKDCRDIAKTLASAKQAIFAQTADIDALIKTVDIFTEQFNAAGLRLEKLVKRREDEIKLEIVNAARGKYAAHIGRIADEIHPVKWALEYPDFNAAIKGKRTIASLHNAVDTCLAQTMIEDEGNARELRAKHQWYEANVGTYAMLFSDLQAIIQKPVDDFKLLVETRISQHQLAEQERVKAQAEVERERIRKEEEAKAQAAARAEADRQRAEQEAEQALKLAEAQAIADAEKARQEAEMQALDDALQAQAAKAADASIVGHQDEITEFFNFRKADLETVKKIRPWLIEFLRFMDSRKMAKAA